MAFPLQLSTSALLLLTALAACTPKLDGEDTGEDSGTASSSTTSSDGATTSASNSNSDPTSPTTATAGTSETASGSGGSSATSTSTSATSGAEDTGGTTVSTSTGTSATATSDTDSGDPVDPPVPCAGEATPLVGITTQMAYLKSQVPPQPDPTGGTSTTGGRDQDPGTLFLHLSDQAYTCDDPTANLKCGQHWSLTIVIPPEFQSPGVHNLLGQDVFAIASETDVDAGQNECGFGGGSFEGTLEILAIDDKTVEARLCNVADFFSFTDPQLEGSFTATRCPE